MGAASGSVSSRVGRHGHVETAVIGGGEVTEEQLLGILKPEDVQANGADELAACVFSILHLPHDVERNTGRNGAWNRDQRNITGHLHGHVDDGRIAVPT